MAKHPQAKLPEWHEGALGNFFPLYRVFGFFEQTLTEVDWLERRPIGVPVRVSGNPSWWNESIVPVISF